MPVRAQGCLKYAYTNPQGTQQGYLAHKKQRHTPALGSQGGAVSYDRCSPVGSPLDPGDQPLSGASRVPILGLQVGRPIPPHKAMANPPITRVHVSRTSLSNLKTGEERIQMNPDRVWSLPTPLGAIGALMNRVLQPRPLVVLGLNVWMGTAAGADELVEIQKIPPRTNAHPLLLSTSLEHKRSNKTGHAYDPSCRSFFGDTI